MKKLITTILFGILYSISAQGQDTKTVVGVYLKTQWLVSDDGEKVSVEFKKEDGSVIPFIEDASSFISPGKDKEQKELLFFDDAIKGSDKTKKENVGKKFVIECYDIYDKIVSVKPFSSEILKSASTSTVYVPSVKIGNQVWMSKNLDVVKYRNGDAIPQIEDYNTFINSMTGAWCYNQGDKKGGKLYNWYALNDPRGLAPEGWRMPSKNDFTQLVNFLGGSNSAYKKLKHTKGWEGKNEEYEGNPEYNGTNESGFSALPAGARVNIGDVYFNSEAWIWTTTVQIVNGKVMENSVEVLIIRANDSNEEVSYNFVPKNYAASIRCIKD